MCRGGGVGHACRCMSEWRAQVFPAVVIELLLRFVLKVGFYIMKWNVTYKCVCVCAELLLHLS